MDKSTLYARISQCHQEISYCNEQIRRHEKDIDELEKLCAGFRMYDSDFSDMQFKRKQNLSAVVSGLSQQHRYSSNIINGFESGMHELLYGSENSGVYRNLDDMISIANGEIRKKYAQIDECIRKIAVCNSTIASCESEIRALEEQERKWREAEYDGYYNR